MPSAKVNGAEIYYEEGEAGLRSFFPPEGFRVRWQGTGR